MKRFSAAAIRRRGLGASSSCSPSPPARGIFAARSMLELRCGLLLKVHGACEFAQRRGTVFLRGCVAWRVAGEVGDGL